MLHSMRQFFCSADSLITITLWQNHIFVVMAVAPDGLVLGARAFADTVWCKFRSCTCSWIIPQGLAGDVSVTCAIIGLWFMITHLTFQYGLLLLHTCAHVCVCFAGVSTIALINFSADVIRYFHPPIFSPLGENIVWHFHPGVKISLRYLHSPYDIFNPPPNQGNIWQAYHL